MSAESKSEGKGCSIGGIEMAILTLVFLALKLGPVPEMPWAVVLAPLWLPFAFSLIILALICVAGILFVLGAVGWMAWEGLSGIWKGGGK